MSAVDWTSIDASLRPTTATPDEVGAAIDRAMRDGESVLRRRRISRSVVACAGVAVVVAGAFMARQAAHSAQHLSASSPLTQTVRSSPLTQTVRSSPLTQTVGSSAGSDNKFTHGNTPTPQRTVDVTSQTTAVTSAPSSSDTITDQGTFGAPPTVDLIRPNTGDPSGGTKVTILGDGFTQGATVIFGSGTAAKVAVKSGTKITASSPPGPTDSKGRPLEDSSVHVTVQTADGTSSTSDSDVFTYQSELIS